MTPNIKELLTKLKNERKDLSKKFVFLNRRRTHYGDCLNRKWNDAVKKAMLPKLRLTEGTRHSFAMQRLERGYSYEEFGAILGHKWVSTTQEFYAKLNAKKLSYVVEMKDRVSPKCHQGR